MKRVAPAVVTKPTPSLADQIKEKISVKPSDKKELDGNIEKMISTGSTLLDLAISGGRVRGGGIPGGVLVEIFGPSSSGKTIMLSEIAGYIQRQGGKIMFHDPEARLNKQFARMFDLDTDKMDYLISDTVTGVFESVRKWKPDNKAINGIFADSLAALSTDLEMDKDAGDTMGTRRAKEFSEQLRRTCRVLMEKNYVMVCSNQIRQNVGVTFGPKFSTPGGESVGFYSSVRLKTNSPSKIRQEESVAGKDVTRVIGIQVDVEVFKNSVWKPYHTAPLTILFDYGIDDIRANLQFIKDHTENKVYCLGEQKLSNSIDKAISIIESEQEYIKQLKNEVIDLWMEIESKFETERKPKLR